MPRVSKLNHAENHSVLAVLQLLENCSCQLSCDSSIVCSLVCILLRLSLGYRIFTSDFFLRIAIGSDGPCVGVCAINSSQQGVARRERKHL